MAWRGVVRRVEAWQVEAWFGFSHTERQEAMRHKRVPAPEVTAVGPVAQDPLHNGVSNGAAAALAFSAPYTVAVTIQGTADLLFHRWDCDAVAEKASAAKNSAAKKTDNVESYVYRNQDGMLCLPGEYVRQAIITAAKFRQDPRSPRKSAMDLYKAGVIALTSLASLGCTTWDYEHKARVQVQRNGLTRVRPALHAGWVAHLALLVHTPEYIAPAMLHDTLNQAGRLIGVGDFRPTYGRFLVIRFAVLED